LIGREEFQALATKVEHEERDETVRGEWIAALGACANGA